LKKCGVKLQIKTSMWPHQRNSTGYRVTINGTEITMYTHDDAGMPIEEDPWMECTIKPLRFVNQLLQSTGSAYRLMVFEPGGPDAIVFLAPEDILALLPTKPTLDEFTFLQP
jgi:hypothetical protein